MLFEFDPKMEQKAKLKVIGVGGIFSGEHAAEYILAGASAVQIGSANLVGLSAPWRILTELQDWMVESGVTDLRSLS